MSKQSSSVIDIELRVALERIEIEMLKRKLIDKTVRGNDGVRPRGLLTRMAAAAKTSPQQVEHWYNRGTWPKPSHFAALAETLDCSMYWLRDGIRPENFKAEGVGNDIDQADSEVSLTDAIIEIGRLTDITLLSPTVLRSLARQVVDGRDDARSAEGVAALVWANFAEAAGL